MIQNLNEELFSFIKKSPTGFHAVHELANYLTEAGFERLAEGNTWNLAEGGKYFVTRNQSAIIAFKVSRKDYSGFHIAASHSDSPTLKIKESSEMNIENQYVKLNVEKYGGMLCAPWFDRPLSVAGRIIVKDGNRLTTKLINVDRDLLMIPNLAIHMNREVNDGYKYNIQKDMLPLYRMSNSGKAFKEMIAVFTALSNVTKKHGLYLAAQCCEHLNRALIVEEECAEKYGLEMVNVKPQLKAGGSFSTAAWNEFEHPCAVEYIQAHAGIDIGDTLIGMHLRHVAVPVRTTIKSIGSAHVVCARTRLKYIGGERAAYQK